MHPIDFPTTHWTTILEPAAQATDQKQKALERLFEIYRLPIVKYIESLARHPQNAEDIAHEFIKRLLAREDIAKMDRKKGSFRGFLKASMRNFVSSHYSSRDALKRRPENADPLDNVQNILSHSADPEQEFTRGWWRATLNEAIRRLRLEWEKAGKRDLFDDIELSLWDENDSLPINEIAKRHVMTPNAVSLCKLRLRDRLSLVLKSVISETVDSPEQVEDEIRFLFQDS